MEDFPLPNIIDVIAAIIISFGIIQGFFRGLSGELARLISLIATFILGILFYRYFGIWLIENSEMDIRVLQALAFVCTIALSTLLLMASRLYLKNALEEVMNKKADKLLGCLAGFIRAAIVILVIYIFMLIIPSKTVNRLFGEESIIGAGVVHIMPKIDELREEGEKLIEEHRD